MKFYLRNLSLVSLFTLNFESLHWLKERKLIDLKHSTFHISIIRIESKARSSIRGIPTMKWPIIFNHTRGKHSNTGAKRKIFGKIEMKKI